MYQLRAAATFPASPGAVEPRPRRTSKRSVPSRSREGSPEPRLPTKWVSRNSPDDWRLSLSRKIRLSLSMDDGYTWRLSPLTWGTNPADEDCSPNGEVAGRTHRSS